MSTEDIQIFPFFMEEGVLNYEIPEIHENTSIFRSMVLEKTTLKTENWFLSDGSTIEKIYFWNHKEAKKTDLIKLGIELSKSGVDLNVKVPSNKRTYKKK